MDDVRKYIYTTLVIFATGIVAWVSYIFVNACGLNFSCPPGTPLTDRTPVPTLVAATLPVSNHTGQMDFNKCKVGATDLLGAWVSAGYSETETFPFTDLNGQTCEATYGNDIQPLLTQSGLWYVNSLSCTSCHNPDLETADAKLDLTSYQAILLGSGRADANAQGNDILGGGDWEKSKLYDLLVKHSATPPGHPAEVPASGPLIYAGHLIIAVSTQAASAPAATPTP